MDDHYAALALSYLRGPTNRNLTALLETGIRPATLLGNCHQHFADMGIPEQLRGLEPRIALALKHLQALQAQILCFGDADYPNLLATIPDPPAFLFVRGNPLILDLPQIAVVGSRNASRSGRADSFELAAQLARGGFVIASGLALGIDAAAHRGALDARGHTLAVVGTGLDSVYPRANRGLADQILAAGGAIVSEFPPGTPPRRENFPRRNRVISGFASAVLVVEARARSGSLVTARFAMEQGRGLCALPGGIRDPLKEGCHRLIREGATLVTSAQEIAECASSLLGVSAQMGQEGLDRNRVQRRPDHPILEQLGADPLNFDQLLERTRLSAAELAAQLSDLELQGRLYRAVDGFRRTS